MHGQIDFESVGAEERLKTLLNIKEESVQDIKTNSDLKIG